MKVPIKRSLVSETYSIIRDAIESGRWERILPGERTLCNIFQISRPTLRRALQQLETEGIIVNSQGKKRRISKQPETPVKRSNEIHIGYLCPAPTHEILGYTHRKIAAIEHFIHQKQMNFALHSRPGCFTKSPAKALRAIIDETQANCWIVQQTNLEMQQWFESENIPTVISGTPHDGINLPYIDLDNEAICRHAVGLLIAKSFRYICYLTTNDFFPGDLQSDAGFLSGIESSAEAHGLIARHNGTRDGICAKLDMLLNAKETPDAFIIDKSNHAFTVTSYLLQKGTRIPDDIALICRTESLDFSYMKPSVAHYSRNTIELAKRTADLAAKIAIGETVDVQGTLIIPDLNPGESI